MLTPDELMDKMGIAAYEFEDANKQVRKLELDKQIKEAKTNIILTSKRWDMIKNKNLQNHVKLCCEDPRFKPTIDFIKQATYIEHSELFDEYNIAVLRAKHAKDEFDMWQKQLSWYQSKNKLEGLELMALGSNK